MIKKIQKKPKKTFQFIYLLNMAEKPLTLEEFKKDLGTKYNEVLGIFPAEQFDEALNQREFKKDIVDRVVLKKALYKEGFFKGNLLSFSVFSPF
jgi:hypothetical protein